MDYVQLWEIWTELTVRFAVLYQLLQRLSGALPSGYLLLF